MENTYSAFISYRHLPLDSEVAKEIEKQLEHYTIPKAYREKMGGKKLKRLFRDEDELPLVADLDQSIKVALDQSEWLLVVCTPNLPKSEWCLKEVEYFIEKKGRDHIIPILAYGEPETSFPPQLLSKIDEEGNTVAIEPLAVNAKGNNARERKKVISFEKYRIIAKMLDVGFDDLRQRQKEYQNKLYLIYALAALLIVSGFAGLAVSRAISINNERIKTTKSDIDLLVEKSLLKSSQDDDLEARSIAKEALEISKTIDDYHMDEIISAYGAACYTLNFDVIQNVKVDTSRIYSLSYSNDDKYFGGISTYNSVIICDGETGLQLYEIYYFTWVTDYAFSPDCTKLLIYSCEGNHLSLYDLKTGEQLGDYKRDDIKYQSELNWAQFNYENNVVVFDNGNFLVLDGNNLAEITKFEMPFENNSMYGVAGGNNGGRYYAFCPIMGQDSVIVLDSKKEEYFFINRSDFPQAISDIAVSPNEKLIAVDFYGRLFIYDIEKDQRTILNNEPVTNSNLSFSKDSSILMTSQDTLKTSSDPFTNITGIITGYNVKSGKQIWQVIQDDCSYSGSQIKQSGNGKYFVTDNYSNLIYKVADGEIAYDVTDENLSVQAFSHDSSRILGLTDEALTINAMTSYTTIDYLSTYKGDIYMAPQGNLPAGTNLTSYYYDPTPDGAFMQEKFYISPNGLYVVVINNGTYIKLWDISKSSEMLYRFYYHTWYGYTNCNEVVFSGDSRYFVTAGYDGSCIVFDMEELKVVIAIQAYDRWQNMVQSVRISPNGKYIMLTDYNYENFKVYSILDGAKLYDIWVSDKVVDFGFDTETGNAMVVFDDGSALEELIFNSEEEINDFLNK